MSRIGLSPIKLPDGVDVKVDNNIVTVKGSKGELTEKYDTSAVSIKVEDNEIVLERKSEDKDHKSKHGLYRALLQNAVVGVTEGYKKEMELVGVGYRATAQGQNLELSLGFSHNIVFQLPKEVKVTAVSERGKNPLVTLESYDKQLIGMCAAKLRSLRSPEPYKGKGIRFVGEHIRRKAGKAAAK
ncbi:50S ribosomal protein L6 [Salibacter sp.]|uniref:50S ribosomal protein L6 n=1 Tax=Salibacter sp. TaxID=2010995 RepID=UPI0028707AA5|nr:50S ribosomal protein L6 [Salibacter sp.]MDR9488015.1 50S ribosomal protein L6 [Salibacter sp.]